MQISDLETLASKFGAADVPEFINKYVKALVGGSMGLTTEINTDFDYRTKKPRGPIYRCIGVEGNILRLVPAYDYANNRWFVSLYLSVENIVGVSTFDQAKNKYRQGFEQKLRNEIAEGKFANRDTGRIIGADVPEAIRSYPTDKE